MPAVLPGKPQAKFQAISTGRWDGRRIIAYVSGNALVILTGPDTIHQTIYQDDSGPLQALAFDEVSGKIATCSTCNVYIHEHNGRTGDSLKWSQQHHIDCGTNEDPLTALSWGVAQELLLGSSWLQIYSTTESPSTLWKQKLANPAKIALFSPDARYIASTGQYDRLVKIWRRLSFDVDDMRFDFAYLPHPSTVTNIYWQNTSRSKRSINGVLYTTCADNILRIWAASDPHCLQILQLWGDINLQESIKPRLHELHSASIERYAFIVGANDFTLATEQAIQTLKGDEREAHAVDHLSEVAHRNPEICVVLDKAGRMSAWGLENIGSKTRKTTQIFNIAHVDGVKLSFDQRFSSQDSQENFLRLYCFWEESRGSQFVILAHHSDGRIEWWEANVDGLFDPSPRSKRLQSKAVWTGHTSSIKKIVRSVSGKALVSRTDGSEAILWKQKLEQAQSRLVIHSALQVEEKIHRICVLDEGNLVILLHPSSVSVWETKSSKATQLTSKSFELEGQALCLLLLPELTARTGYIHVATISSKMKGVAWEIIVPSHLANENNRNTRDDIAPIVEFCRFDLGTEDEFAFVIPVDPAGSSSTISGFLDVFARDIAISFNDAGILRSWTAKVDTKRRCVEWLLTSSVETGIPNLSLASGSSIRKAALVDNKKTGLTIWDTREAQLEFAEDFEEPIRDLDWTSTPDNQSVLAIGFIHHVLLLSQLRYDYLDAGPAWAVLREIRLTDLTPHPIGDSVWLSHGDLVVGTGNQLFVYDRKIEVAGTLATTLRLSAHHQPLSTELFSVVTRLNGQLPVFHPQFVSQCILRGNLVLVQRILVALHKRLKFYTEGDDIDSFVGLPIEDFLDGDEQRPNVAKKELYASYADLRGDENQDDSLTESVAASLNEQLSIISIPHLSSREQIHLANIVECVAVVEKHTRSMDENASRFLLFFRQYMLRKSQHAPNLADISWREITWALHSNSQDILVDLVSRHFHGRMGWQQVRECGMLMWLKDISAVRKQFEIIARNQYTRTEEKNPIDCSLFYLALKKKNVLIGLWRMAAWHPEQRSTQRLLTNNFQEPRWKTAALKNAYALLEYAAAFFLLAGSLKDAVSACVNQLGDLQLGIAIARVYEGDEGPIFKGLLGQYVLPRAAADGNRWLATWAFWMLNRRDMAVRSLVSPVHTLLEEIESPTLQAKTFLADDPALVNLYRQLREKTLQTLSGASKVSPRVEWDFLIHIARLYDRMGCDILALELVYNWEFLRQPIAEKKRMDTVADPRKMLRRRSSLVVADLPNHMVPSEIKSGGTKPPSSLFEEPDTNSLLDNFGY